MKGPPLLLTRAGQKDRRNPSAGPLASADLPAEQVTGAPIQFLVPPFFWQGVFGEVGANLQTLKLVG